MRLELGTGSYLGQSERVTLSTKVSDLVGVDQESPANWLVSQKIAETLDKRTNCDCNKCIFQQPASK